MVNGKEQAFLMRPLVQSVREPSTLLIIGVMAVAVVRLRTAGEQPR